MVKIIKMNSQPSIDSQNQPLFSILQEMTQAGLIPLVILLIQRIKNQRWFRESNISVAKQSETTDQSTELVLQLIELFSRFSTRQFSFSKTVVTFIDKIEFFTQLAKIIAKDPKAPPQ